MNKREEETILCPVCAGSGVGRCRMCSGAGTVPNKNHGPSSPKDTICPTCGGTGKGKQKCCFCNGGKIYLRP